MLLSGNSQTLWVTSHPLVAHCHKERDQGDTMGFVDSGDMAGNLLDKVSPLVEFEVPDDLEEEKTSL